MRAHTSTSEMRRWNAIFFFFCSTFHPMCVRSDWIMDFCLFSVLRVRCDSVPLSNREATTFDLYGFFQFYFRLLFTWFIDNKNLRRPTRRRRRWRTMNNRYRYRIKCECVRVCCVGLVRVCVFFSKFEFYGFFVLFLAKIKVHSCEWVRLGCRLPLSNWNAFEKLVYFFWLRPGWSRGRGHRETHIWFLIFSVSLPETVVRTSAGIGMQQTKCIRCLHTRARTHTVSSAVEIGLIGTGPTAAVAKQIYSNNG